MQLGEEADQILQAAAEPIDRPRHHHVELPLGSIPAQPIKCRALVPAFGAADAVVLVDMDECRPAVKFVRALYKEAMDPEVLSWDDAGNNRYLASGRGSWIHNPISAYRSIQKATPDLADKIFIWKTPAGPVRRLAGSSPNSYGIWRFARNKEAATEFLRYVGPLQSG